MEAGDWLCCAAFLAACPVECRGGSAERTAHRLNCNTVIAAAAAATAATAAAAAAADVTASCLAARATAAR